MHFDSPPATTGPATGRCLVMVTPTRSERVHVPRRGRRARTRRRRPRPRRQFRRDLPRGLPVGPPPAKKAIRKAAAAARSADRPVALTLSDPFCVGPAPRGVPSSSSPTTIDILFANEAEICSLYEVDDLDDALHRGARPLPRSRRSHAGRARLGRHRRRRRARDRRRAGGPAGRHDGCRRPVRRRVPLRPDPRPRRSPRAAVSARWRPPR